VSGTEHNGDPATADRGVLAFDLQVGSIATRMAKEQAMLACSCI
jgi:hypothetical protein